MKTGNNVMLFVAVFAVTVLAFYGLDHLIMNSQGLPLNWNMTPAQ